MYYQTVVFLVIYAEQDVSLRGSKRLESIATADTDAYSPKYGYFLQLQHTTTQCPPYGRKDGLK